MFPPYPTGKPASAETHLYDRLRRFVVLLAVLFFLAACAGPSGSAAPAPEQVPTIVDKSSGTTGDPALAWAEAYGAAHPGVRLSVTGGGSGTGLAALINGTVDIANASRAIKSEEKEQAQGNGGEPGGGGG